LLRELEDKSLAHTEHLLGERLRKGLGQRPDIVALLSHKLLLLDFHKPLDGTDVLLWAEALDGHLNQAQVKRRNWSHHQIASAPVGI